MNKQTRQIKFNILRNQTLFKLKVIYLKFKFWKWAWFILNNRNKPGKAREVFGVVYHWVVYTKPAAYRIQFSSSTVTHLVCGQTFFFEGNSYQWRCPICYKSPKDVEFDVNMKILGWPWYKYQEKADNEIPHKI